MIDAVEEEKHKNGDIIIKQGESGLNFYLLEVHKISKTLPNIIFFVVKEMYELYIVQ